MSVGLYVSCGVSIASVWERAGLSPLSFVCGCMVSVRRGFHFLLVLGMGCVILLWHSQGLPYNYFVISYIEH